VGSMNAMLSVNAGNGDSTQTTRCATALRRR
jgi:hypothetical protein